MNIECKNTCIVCDELSLIEDELDCRFTFQPSGKVILHSKSNTNHYACCLNSVKYICLLFKNKRKILTKEEIEEYIWPGSKIGNNSLPVLTCKTRKIIEQNSNYSIYTIRCKGYLLK
ncbi:winged helix-turn-helix domain-containing protein [Vibrio sp. TRT 17S01]|uniref:winged helix-turn-helix domain-containing protein n=1 Tax=Vibrio sp. TRT 17S01 TaxID=3418505 RepID=UPI003CF8E6BB